MPDERTGRLNAIRSQGTGKAVVFLHGFTGTRDDTWDRFPGLLGSAALDWDIFTIGYATTLLPDVVGVWSADPDLPVLGSMLSTQLGLPPFGGYRSLTIRDWLRACNTSSSSARRVVDFARPAGRRSGSASC